MGLSGEERDHDADRRTCCGSMPGKKLVWLIPVVLFSYLIYVNALPFGATYEFFIDFGSEDTDGEARLTGPMDRVSGPIIMDNITYRNLEGKYVYFELTSPHLSISSRVVIEARYSNVLDGQKIILGARNGNVWSFSWKDVSALVREGSPDSSIQIWGGDNRGEHGTVLTQNRVSTENEWRVVRVEWEPKDLYLINGHTLQFVFYTPHLGNEEYAEFTVPVDWVRITLVVSPLTER